MQAAQLFEEGKAGWRIRYGAPDAPLVELNYVNRGWMYANGHEEGTGRCVFVFLCAGLLKDVQRGSFSEFERVA